jgi:hypothetical protein
MDWGGIISQKKESTCSDEMNATEKSQCNDN